MIPGFKPLLTQFKLLADTGLSVPGSPTAACSVQGSAPHAAACSLLGSASPGRLCNAMPPPFARLSATAQQLPPAAAGPPSLCTTSKVSLTFFGIGIFPHRLQTIPAVAKASLASLLHAQLSLPHTDWTVGIQQSPCGRPSPGPRGPVHSHQHPQQLVSYLQHITALGVLI